MRQGLAGFDAWKVSLLESNSPGGRVVTPTLATGLNALGEGHGHKHLLLDIILEPNSAAVAGCSPFVPGYNYADIGYAAVISLLVLTHPVRGFASEHLWDSIVYCFDIVVAARGVDPGTGHFTPALIIRSANRLRRGWNVESSFCPSEQPRAPYNDNPVALYASDEVAPEGIT